MIFALRISAFYVLVFVTIKVVDDAVQAAASPACTRQDRTEHYR